MNAFRNMSCDMLDHINIGEMVQVNKKTFVNDLL